MPSLRKFSLLSCVAACAALGMIAAAQAAETKGPVTDEIGPPDDDDGDPGAAAAAEPG